MFILGLESPTTDQLEEFLGEISTMKRVGKHQNVVRLLGFCTLEQPLMMIMEFVPCGDLVSPNSNKRFSLEVNIYYCLFQNT